MDTSDIVALINKISITIETILLSQHILSLYLVRTGPLKNGIERGMSVMFIANILYHLAIIAALIAVNVYYTTSLSLPYIIVSLLVLTGRINLAFSNYYLFHNLRKYTTLLIEKEEAINDCP